MLHSIGNRNSSKNLKLIKIRFHDNCNIYIVNYDEFSFNNCAQIIPKLLQFIIVYNIIYYCM